MAIPTARAISLDWTVLHLFGLLFVGLVAMQLLPLPSSWLRVVSPQTLKVYERAGATISPFLTISLYKYATRLGLFKILAYVGVFFLVTNWANSKEKIKILIQALIALGLFETFYGLFTSLSNHPFIQWLKAVPTGPFVTGTYINRNHLAGLLEMIIPILFGLLIVHMGSQGERKRKPEKRRDGLRSFLLSLDLGNAEKAKIALLIFLLAMLMVGLFLSGSRGGIIALTLSFLFMHGLLLFRKKYRLYASLILIVLLIALGYSLYLGMDGTWQRFDSLINKGDKSRIHLMQTSYQAWQAFPVVGTGFGTFLEVYRKYKRAEDYVHEVDHAHNDWIELGVETGWFGFTLILSFFFFSLGYFLYLWSRRKNSFSLGLGLGGMGAMVALGLHSLVDFNLHIPANAFILCLIGGITLKGLTLPLQQSSPGKRMEHAITIPITGWLRWPLALAVIGLFYFLAVLIWKPYLAERILHTLPDSTLEERKAPSLEDIQKALHHEQGNANYYYWLALVLENQNEGNILITEKAAPQNPIFLALKKAIRLNPVKAEYHLHLAWHMLRVGNQRILHGADSSDQFNKIMIEAEKEFDRAVFFAPNSAEMNFSSGCYWLWKSKLSEDEEVYSKALDKSMHYLQVTYQLDPGYRQPVIDIIQQYYPGQTIL